MSAIKLNSSGGGSITISPASTASTLTLTAPAATGTIVTTGNSGVPYFDASGNVGIGTTTPTAFDTNGRTLTIAGPSASSPGTLIIAGNAGVTLGNGYYASEVFRVTGVTSATEITRITGTSSNGLGLYIKITANGHTSAVGSGVNVKEFIYEGGTSAPTQISSVTHSAFPVISFDTSTTNVCVVRIASFNGSAAMNGVVRVEWQVPPDFFGGTAGTWTIS
jgi:hypothetical protein